jgi:hypothetical protein
LTGFNLNPSRGKFSAPKLVCRPAADGPGKERSFRRGLSCRKKLAATKRQANHSSRCGIELLVMCQYGHDSLLHFAGHASVVFFNEDVHLASDAEIVKIDSGLDGETGSRNYLA